MRTWFHVLPHPAHPGCSIREAIAEWTAANAKKRVPAPA
jgi:hypothetical protein